MATKRQVVRLREMIDRQPIKQEPGCFGTSDRVTIGTLGKCDFCTWSDACFYRYDRSHL